MADRKCSDKPIGPISGYDSAASCASYLIYSSSESPELGLKYTYLDGSLTTYLDDVL